LPLGRTTTGKSVPFILFGVIKINASGMARTRLARVGLGAGRVAGLSGTSWLHDCNDIFRTTSMNTLTKMAPGVVFVADYARMKLVPAGQRESHAWAAAGAMAQNVYLYCASAGLATVIRAWIDRGALAQALGLNNEQQVLLSQTVGRPKIVALP
jgi:hypothetical protein